MGALGPRGCMILLQLARSRCARKGVLAGADPVQRTGGGDDSIEHLRESMHESSLEGIFGQLTREQDHRAVAEHILEVMRA